MHFISHGIVVAHNENQFGEEPVQNNLSLTPTEIALKNSRGAKIDTEVLADMASYDNDNSFSTDVESLRGMDMNTAWEIEQNSNRRLSKFKDGVIDNLTKNPS